MHGVRLCVASRLLSKVGVRHRGRGLRFAATVRNKARWNVTLYRVSHKRRVLHPLTVKRYSKRLKAFTWNGKAKRVEDGYYVATFTARSGKFADARRIPLLRKHHRFYALPAYVATERCRLLTAARVGLPDWGGTTKARLRISFRTLIAAKVTVTVTRAGHRIKRFTIKRDRGEDDPSPRERRAAGARPVPDDRQRDGRQGPRDPALRLAQDLTRAPPYNRAVISRPSARSASSSPSPAWTGTTAARRSSPARCATPAWRSSTPACTRRPSRSSRP